MTVEPKVPAREKQGRKIIYRNAASAPVYGIGLVGALFYYLQHAATFLAAVVAILKAIVWPALLVYKLLEFLKM